MITLKQHNIPSHETLDEMMQQVQRCALVAATGTGKSYIAAKYIETHGLARKTLILMPNRAVMDTWRSLLPDTDLMTYQAMQLHHPDFAGYQLIVCDEMHHLGAENWGNVFRELARHPEQKILGLTATPIRYLDDGRDMVHEFFDGNLVKGIQLSEAIQDGILPSFEYITALYDVPERKPSKNDITENLYAKLDLMTNEYSFRRILRKHLTKSRAFPQIKAVVFVSAISEIEEIRTICRQEFPEALHLSACSKYKDAENQEAYQIFEEDGIHDIFLYAVDILSEGRHLKGTNVEIMFRRTRSPIVYLQQLGRVLDSGNKDVRVKIFDFVANHTNMKEYSDLKKNTVTWINDGIHNPDRQVIQYDYAMEELELIDKIRHLESGQWSEEEDGLMFKYYQKEGPGFLEKFLPGRSRTAIISHAMLLGLSKKKEKPNQEFFNDIKAYYGKENRWKILLGKYPQYSKSYITNVANRMGITTRKRSESWSADEDEILRRDANLPVTELMELLPGRSRASITGRKHVLGISSRNCHKWTEEEILLLRQNADLTAKELANQYFPELPEDMINRAKARYACSREIKWTQERITLFRQLYQEGGFRKVLTNPDFAGMSRSAIQGAANRYGVKSEAKRHVTWTEEEKELCRKWLALPEEERSSRQSLASKIPNHTPNGIKDMCRRLQKGLAE